MLIMEGWFLAVIIVCSTTHPKNTKSFTDGPATQEVDLKVVVEDDDHVLLAKHVCRGLVGVQGAIGAWPPLQHHHQLCKGERMEHVILHLAGNQSLNGRTFLESSPKTFKYIINRMSNVWGASTPPHSPAVAFPQAYSETRTCTHGSRASRRAGSWFCGRAACWWARGHTCRAEWS